MHATPDDLFRRFDALGIKVETHHHEPVFTVAEAQHLRGILPGGHCKSLFLRDKRNGEWLVVVDEERRVDLKALAGITGAGKFSFGSPERLRDRLGVEPGSVTPFALVNDRERAIRVVLDAAMLAHDPLNYHPLVNTMTCAIARDDLLKFIEACGHKPQIIDFDTPT